MKFVSLLLVASLVFSACGSPHSTNQRSFEPRITEYSNEQLFDGIIFRAGPVTELIPEIKYEQSLENAFTTEEGKKGAYQVMEYVKSEIAKSRPDFIHDFAAKIKSGDHLIISSALKEYGAEVNRILKQHAYAQVDNQESMCVTVAAAAAAVYIVAAVHSAVVAASVAAVSAAVVVYIGLWDDMPQVQGIYSTEMQIGHDIVFDSMVNSIAISFAESSSK